MKRLIIIGAGDLGQQIAHFVTTDHQFEVVGYVDDWQVKGTVVKGKPVMGCIDDLLSIYNNSLFDEAIIGVGYKHFEFRKSLYERFKGTIPFATFVHSSCYVDPTAEIGDGVVIYPRCIVVRNVLIKDNVFVNWGTGIGHDSILEPHSFFAPMVHLAGLVHIGEMCMLGIGAIAIDYIFIADSTTIGGGAVVVKSIETPNGIYVGNPARFLKQRN